MESNHLNIDLQSNASPICYSTHPYKLPFTGLEPVLIKELDFKSNASTIPPKGLLKLILLPRMYEVKMQHTNNLK